MKPSEILRKAAKRIEDDMHWGGCAAINCAAPYRAVKARKRAYAIYHKHFFRRTRDGFWWGASDKNARILGLCLAAEIARQGGE